MLIIRGLGRKNLLVVWGLGKSAEVVFGAAPGSLKYYEEYLRQGTVWFRSSYKVEGQKAFKFKKKTGILGQLKCKLIENFILIGSKELGYLAEKYISGEKQFNLTESVKIIGNKSYTINEKIIEISGDKEFTLNESIEIKGKKDILSVLEAIDLL